MKKSRIGIAAVLFLTVLTGCVKKQETSGKVKDLEFTVLRTEDIPEETAALIEEKADQPFQAFYIDQGYLYLVRGYGEQPTSGYSVEVEAVYETETEIVVRTNLLGPEAGEEKKETKTTPYIVLKTEAEEKPVRFE